MALYSVEQLQGRRIEEGPLLFAVAISAANILKDLREHITNTFGGRMSRYETLAEQAIERALDSLKAKARDGGFDGVIGVRIGHPKIVEGGVEVVVYGTPFRYVEGAP
ncbi:MAG: heavy metal-binding domain-containing protein [Hyphomicrobiaceae bacterium]